MSTDHLPQLLELLGFLSDANPQVRRIALAELLPYTAPGKSERSIFLRPGIIEQLAKLCADNNLIAHDALSALVNLTNDESTSSRLGRVDGFLAGLVRMIIDEKALLSDLAAMLLSNITKCQSISADLLKLKMSFTLDSSLDVPKADQVDALALLLEVHLKGESKKYNPNANYDFLASVFANVSTFPQGRAYLLSASDVDSEPPLVKLISFTEHPSVIRRGGVASSIKNSAFDKSAHHRLIAPTNDAQPTTGRIDLLPQMLLPLCGREEFDLDDLENLPIELQILPPDKKREPDPRIRSILVEALVLLATTRTCREAMRSRGVYEVIKLAHLAETDPKVTEPMVQLVNLLKREEGPDTAIEELDEAHASSTVAPSGQKEQDEDEMLIEVL